MKLTSAQIVILSRQFEDSSCPVCHNGKQRRWCFCRNCYFALKRADARLASGLYVSALNGTDEFYENYQKAKEHLRSRGLGDPSWGTRSDTEDLFA